MANQGTAMRRAQFIFLYSASATRFQPASMAALQASPGRIEETANNKEELPR
jgi:hypothetical protein